MLYQSRQLTAWLPIICTRALRRRLHHHHPQAAYKVLFFGSDNFSVPSLQALHANCITATATSATDTTLPIAELAAVTSFKGTDNAVRKFLKTTGSSIPTHSWPLSDPVALCSRFDVGVVVSFGHMIPERIIDAFPLGMINVHASLLPKWRGAAPIIHALRNGDRETGVTIMRIRPRQFDIGEVLAQRTVPIGDETLMPALHAQLANAGAELLVSQMRRLVASLAEARPQDEDSVQYAPKVTDELAQIHWHTLSALDVYNLYRALYSFKHLTTSWHGEAVRIVEVTPPVVLDAATDDERRPPGTVQYCRVARQLRVWCADGRCVGVSRLRVAGKRPMTAADFQNGYLRQMGADQRLAVFV